jgi:hypothetical protein
MNYIQVRVYTDELVTLYKIYVYADETYMQGLATIVEEHGLNPVLDKALGLKEVAYVFDPVSKPEISPAKSISTIEIYSDEKRIWSNTIKD